MYDVIVIGAGPAGCMAAKRIANAGYKVLLVDKMQMPREKSCSGILIKKSVDLVENHFGKIPDTVLCRPNKNRGIIITNEENQVSRFESEEKEEMTLRSLGFSLTGNMKKQLAQPSLLC